MPHLPASWCLGQRLWCELQHRSKVSYHLSYYFSRDKSVVSRDESLGSQEQLKRIVWNKLQAVSLRENDSFLAKQWSLPGESI